MIPRYSRPDMVAIWSPETKFRIWFEIEAHASDALAELGVIPKEAAKTIWEKGGKATFDVARIDEIEAVTKHDVIAFLTHLAEIVGPDARFVHQGMTSSDVLDTCFSVQLVRATDILLDDMDKLLVYPDKMMNNLNKFRGLVHSQRVLLALTQAGVSREDSYRLVQRNAMKVWEEGKDFLEELLADAEVRGALSEADIREKFDLGYHTKHVDTIFSRVFG